MRTIILPGNGNTDIKSQWYLWVKEELELSGVDVVAENMPDAYLARQEYWLPWIEEKSKEDKGIILIGHSSGAIAIMRYLETHKVEGAVLVAAYHTDLGQETEKASHYFDKPWKWETIKRNAQWILQFASADDPFVPLEEARFVRDQLNSEYYEYEDHNHFTATERGEEKTEFPELVEAVKNRLKRAFC